MPKHKYERVGEFTSIYRRGKNWWLNVQYRKRQIRQSLRTQNKKEAQRLARTFEQRLLDGSHSKQHKIEAVSIEDAINALIRNCESEERAPKTITKYRQVLNQMLELADALNINDLTQIDHQFLDEYRHQRKKAGRKPKTIYTEIGIIHRLVLFAKVRRMIAFDPLEGLKLREPKTAPQPCWTPEQVEQILENVAENYLPAFTFLSETGMRVGELRWLTWDDVDMDNKLIHIPP